VVQPTARLAALLPALALTGVLAACATAPPPARTPVAGELVDVPFFAQRRYQCGPAALATVLVDAGVDTDPERLVPQVWLPGRRGSLQTELRAATRRAGRIPWELSGDVDALDQALDQGRPVLVLQNLGASWWPLWHYAVVVGLDERRVVLRSGEQARRLERRDAFLETWTRADRWGLVVLDGRALPEDADRERWLEEASLVERVGHPAVAAQAYEAWLEQHPADRGARFGLASTAHAGGRLEEAAAAYEQLLAADPDDPAVLNNLALVRAEQGCLPAARTLLDRALAAAGDPALRETLEASREELELRASDRPCARERENRP
jgi:tetratricopeptide (TPR) repeat protein